MARVLVLIFGLLVLVVGSVGMVGYSLPGATEAETITRSFPLEPGRTLRVAGVNGRITYERWDGDELVIEAVVCKPRFWSDWFEQLWGEPTVTFTHDEQGVEASALPSGRTWFRPAWRVDFAVKAPIGWHGHIWLTTSNGAITANDIDGDVELHTSNGSVEVLGHKGTLTVRTSNGRLRLADVQGIVNARTSNASVTLIDGTLSGVGQLRTSNGSVELRARLEEGASYEVTTSNGSVALVLIDPDVKVNLRTSNGRINLQTPVTASSMDRNRVVGTIGAGAASLNVGTSNGSITLSAAASN